jgi:anti-sigma regulatory factor (Ser/Thr protein kinase)
MFQLKHRANGFHVSFAATLENVDRVAQETKKFLSERQAEQYVFDITLVLREGLINAVVDGSDLNAEKRVSYTVMLEDNTLLIEIEDTGKGFDWRGHMGRIPLPDSESGRGLAIMELYCDAIHFNEKGNKLTIEKKLHPASPVELKKSLPKN